MAPRTFDLPLLEDANAVQTALMKVIQMLGSGRMDPRTAGLMLYGLQTAASNLRNLDLEPTDPTDVVIDRDDVHRTCLDGPQWYEDDFEGGEQEEADETENEIHEGQQDDEDAAAAPAHAGDVSPNILNGCHSEPGVKPAAEPAVPRTMEEARAQVRGLVRNWLLESAGGYREVKPG